MKLVNLTPHPITFYNELDECIAVIKPVENAVRCTQHTERQGVVDFEDCGPIPVYTTSYDEIVNLPPSQEGVYYIVPLVIANQLPDRDDLLIPSPYKRDEEGKIIGCTGLSQVRRFHH